MNDGQAGRQELTPACPHVSLVSDNDMQSNEASVERIEEEVAELSNLQEEATGKAPRTDQMTQEEVDALMKDVPAVKRQGTFHALRYRNFRLFFFGQMISVAGTWMQTVAQQWLVYDITKSAAWLGIVSGASAIPYVLLTLTGGQVADRFPRRATLVVTQTAAMILAFALAVLVYAKTIQPWHIAVLAALSGIVNAFNMPTQQAFVTDMVDDRSALGNAIALNSLQFNIARFLGPIFAGAVLVKLGSGMCFLLNGLSYLAVIASLLLMRLKPHQVQTSHSSMWEGFGYIRTNHRVLRVILLMGCASLLAWPSATLFPVFATRFHVGAQGYSAMMSANGIGAALGGLMVATLAGRWNRRFLLYGAAFAFSIALLLFASVTHYIAALASLVLAGLCMITFGVNSNTTVQEEVPDSLRGRVMAVYSLVFGGLMPVGGLVIGFLAHRFNASVAVQLNSALFLLITTGVLTWSLSEFRSGQPHLAEAPTD